MTPEAKAFGNLLFKFLLDLNEGLVEPARSTADETAGRLAELTKAIEMLSENLLALDTRLHRMEGEVLCLPTTTDPTDRLMEELENFASAQRPMAYDLQCHLVDLVDCVRVQRGLSREYLAQEVRWPIDGDGAADLLYQIMRIDPVTLGRVAKVVNESAPHRTSAPEPGALLAPPPLTTDVTPPPPATESKRRTSKKQAKKRTKKQKAQAASDEVPVVEPWMSEWADKVAEGMGVPNPSEQTATGETVVRLRAKGGRR